MSGLTQTVKIVSPGQPRGSAGVLWGTRCTSRSPPSCREASRPRGRRSPFKLDLHSHYGSIFWSKLKGNDLAIFKFSICYWKSLFKGHYPRYAKSEKGTSEVFKKNCTKKHVKMNKICIRITKISVNRLKLAWKRLFAQDEEKIGNKRNRRRNIHDSKKGKPVSCSSAEWRWKAQLWAGQSWASWPEHVGFLLDWVRISCLPVNEAVRSKAQKESQGSQTCPLSRLSPCQEIHPGKKV